MKLIPSKLSYLPIIEKFTAVLPTVFVNYTVFLVEFVGTNVVADAPGDVPDHLL